MSNQPRIRVIEQDAAAPICCPFCGFVACPGHGDGSPGWMFDPDTCVCEHTLFVATDDGFEFRSSLFNRRMGLPDNQEADVTMRNHDHAGYDGLTSEVPIEGAVKIACYALAPSFFGVYYGFAPIATGQSE